MAVKAIPEGWHSITPYLRMDNAAQVIDFAKRAFGATDRGTHLDANGKIMHAELMIGDSPIMFSDTMDGATHRPGILYIYTEDVDSMYAAAIAAGGVSMREPTNEFYGDRSSGVRDTAGNEWWIATHVEDVSEEEMQRRMKELGK